MPELQLNCALPIRRASYYALLVGLLGYAVGELLHRMCVHNMYHLIISSNLTGFEG